VLNKTKEWEAPQSKSTTCAQGEEEGGEEGGEEGSSGVSPMEEEEEEGRKLRSRITDRLLF